MNLGDAVVVDPEGSADRILGDLQAAVHVPANRGRKIELNSERQVRDAQTFQQLVAIALSCQCSQDVVGDFLLIGPSGGTHDAPTVNGGVLVIDAGRHREGDGQTVRLDAGRLALIGVWRDGEAWAWADPKRLPKLVHMRDGSRLGANGFRLRGTIGDQANGDLF